MLPATLTKFLHLQPVRSRLPVLGARIVPLFAITALHRNNFSGHENRSWLLALKLKNCVILKATLFVAEGSVYFCATLNPADPSLANDHRRMTNDWLTT